MKPLTHSAVLALALLAGCSETVDGVTQDQLNAATANLASADDIAAHAAVADAHHAPVSDAGALTSGTLDPQRLPTESVLRNELDAVIALQPDIEPSGAVGSQDIAFEATAVTEADGDVELARITVDPSAPADVALMAHVFLERDAGAPGRVSVVIRLDDCVNGTTLGKSLWRAGESSGTFVGDTIALTGFLEDVDGPTDVVLCVAAYANVEFTAYGPGIVAHW